MIDLNRKGTWKTPPQSSLSSPNLSPPQWVSAMRAFHSNFIIKEGDSDTIGRIMSITRVLPRFLHGKEPVFEC